MPRIDPIQTNFTAGEFSPKLYGRVDIARYSNAVKTCENAIPMIFGGVKNRDGTIYVKPAKNDNKLAVLIPFVYNNAQAYILEFGDLYMRVFKDGAQVESSPGVPYEITTPYTEAMLRKIDFQQSADTMFIENELVYPQRLRRFADNVWDLQPAPITVEPFDELGLTPSTTLTLSSAAAGAGRTATAGVATYLASDVGRYINAGAGLALITAFTDSTHVTCTITVPFAGTSIASGGWNIDVSPQATCTPSAKDPVGASITLTLDIDGWRAADVGKYVRINGGLVQITAFTSALIVDGIIKTALTSVVGSPPLAWTLNSSIWNATNGYPRTGALYQQRLLLAGSTRYPQSIAGSRIGNVLNFQIGTADDDGFFFKIAQSQDQILHLTQIRKLLSLGAGGEFSIEGGVEKAITPTNVQINAQAEDGCSEVRPVRVSNEIYFVGRSTKRLFASSYQFNIDGFDAVDVSKIAEHIPDAGIVDMTYQKYPNSIIYIALADGKWATVTIDREENVTGWAHHVTDGDVESFATIPIDGGQQTWMIIKRVINGLTKRYIEYFKDYLKLDCAVMDTSVLGSTTWAGLSHLEGKTVGVLADGIVMGEFTVISGSITLPRAAFEVQIGLPYKTTIELLPIEVASQLGSSQGNSIRSGGATIKLLNSIGCKINDQQIPFRQFGVDILNKPVEPYTGTKRVSLLGWDTENPGVVTITQEQPLPLHVLSIVRRVVVND